MSRQKTSAANAEIQKTSAAPGTEPKPAVPVTPQATVPAVDAAGEPVPPPATDAAPAPDATNPESTLGDGDAKGAEVTPPQGSTAPDASEPVVPVAFVEPDVRDVEIEIVSAVLIDGVEMRSGKAMVPGKVAEDLIRAGAATAASA